MTYRCAGWVSWVSLAGAALLSGTVSAADTVQAIQTLDRVDVYNRTKVLEMEFDDPGRTFDFTALAITPASATGFVACQVTANQALYCIDGKDVRFWAKPSEVAPPNTTGTLLFSCTDAGLGPDPLIAQPCSGLTVDLSGAIWIARKKGATYSLFKLVKNSGPACSSGTPVAAAQYCATERASGWQVLTDLTMIDGDVGAAFVGPAATSGPGVLALEGHTSAGGLLAPANAAWFFPASPVALPVKIAGGNIQWGLAPAEYLQSATLLQFPVANITRNFVLATTSQGRVLAVDALGTSNAFPVFDIPVERAASPSTAEVRCDNLAQQYGLRASSKSRRVYLTDRNFCQAVALEIAPPAGIPFQLQNVQEIKNNVSRDLTFSTTAAYPPDAGTIAPGTVLNLLTCDPECTLISAADGSPAARLSGVQLVGSKSGMTLYQVKDIPDCRWIPTACAGRVDVVVDPQGAIVPLNDPRLGTPQANQFFLNVTPLLPLEITAQFVPNAAPPLGLPRLLISPQYRAQEQTGYLFEALFGRTEDGVVFTGTFNTEFDVAKLAGQNLGCGFDYSEALKPNRAWDVVSTVSERVVSAGGTGDVTVPGNPNRHVDTLTNIDCYNPTQGSGSRWSMYAYNLEIAPNTDAVFAKLLIKLYDDLEITRDKLACRTPAVDTGGAAQLTKAVCANLKKLWSAGKAKLDKCYTASTQPKSSAGSENCQAFLSQLKLYESALNSATTTAALDPANRLGELKQRVLVIGHVYSDRFQPSIPANGFTNL